MNYSIHRFTLDIHRLKSQVTIPVSYMDTGIQLIINLTDGGKPYKIEEGCKAVLYGKKGDGTALTNDCEIIENTRILYTFTDQTTTALGDVACEVRLYGKNGLLLTSPSFVISVGARVIEDDEIIESETERTALDRIFESEAARDEKFVIPFVRYSFNSDGTDFSETYVERMSYVGFAMAKEAPTDKVDYQWVFIGDVLKSDLDAKLDKIKDKGKLYGVDEYGKQKGIPYSSAAEAWAIARYHEKGAFRVGAPVEDVDATPKSYVKELIKNVSFTRKEGDVFNLTITPKEGDSITTEVDLHLEHIFKSVEDFKGEDGKYYLQLTFQDGTTAQYAFDDIFADVDNLFKNLDQRVTQQGFALGNKVQKIDFANATAQDMDTAVHAVTENNVPVLVPVKKNPEPNTVVRRDPVGNVIVPMYSASTPNAAAINKAALMNVQNYAIDQSKKYTDGQITEAKQYSDDQLAPIENRVSALENTLLTLERDTSVAYAKAVPANSYPKAFLNSIGGMTYRRASDNLFPCPAEGITRMADKMISFGEIYLPAGTYSYSVDATYEYEEDRYNYLGFMSNPDNATDPSGYVELSTPFTLEKTTKIYLIGIKEWDFAYGNVNAKVMLNAGSTVKAFSAYFPPYLEDSKVTEVISYGANMLDLATATFGASSQVEVSKQNNVLRLKAKSTSANAGYLSAYHIINNYQFEALYVSATVNISGVMTKGLINVAIYDAATKTRVAFAQPSELPIANGERRGAVYTILEKYRNPAYDVYVLFYLAANERYNAGDYVEYSDIILSTAEVPYTPYREPISYPIPEAIRAQVSGKGVLDITNNNKYLDAVNFDSCKSGRKTNTIILNGAENWKMEDRPSKIDFNFFIDTPIGKRYTPVVSNYFESVVGRSTGMDNNMWISGTGKINCTAIGFASIAEWKAHLDTLYKNGNPVTVTYVLAEPTEEALAAEFDKKIEVFAGGHLEFKNDKGNAVPSDVAFITSK